MKRDESDMTAVEHVLATNAFSDRGDVEKFVELEMEDGKSDRCKEVDRALARHQDWTTDRPDRVCSCTRSCLGFRLPGGTDRTLPSRLAHRDHDRYG